MGKERGRHKQRERQRVSVDRERMKERGR